VAGRVSRLMWDGPRGEQGCFLRLLAPPGSALPARIPLKRIAPGSGLGDLGVGGGGRVAEWAEAIPALEAPEYRRLWLTPGGLSLSRRRSPGRPIICGRLGARWRLPRSGEPLPTSSVGGRWGVLCRGAPKAPYPSYWGWLYGSGGGIGPSSVGGSGGARTLDDSLTTPAV